MVLAMALVACTAWQPASAQSARARATAKVDLDSRFADVGFVPYKLIKGKAVLVFWPFSAFKTLP